MKAKTIAELFDLTGKSAIVTGGAMGIGQGIAFRLAEAGAAVMISDINLDSAAETVELIKARGGKAQAVRADARSTYDATKVTQETVDAFGRLDILVNNAGTFPTSPALELSEEMWDITLDTNLKGVFFYSQAVARHMIGAGHGGKIINMSSADAIRPFGNLAHYDASKAGVLGLTRALAKEWAPHRILVNAVLPGSVSTPGSAGGFEALLRICKDKGIDPEEWLKRQTENMLLGMQEPDDIAKVVLCIASGATDLMTGSAVLVDGGYVVS